MTEILKELIKILPENKISQAGFEAANIVLYTKDREFFANNDGVIRAAVEQFKKRIELRPDPAICVDAETAEKKIKQILPEDAGIGQCIFDTQRSIVYIEAEKPGLAIGKQGALLRELREQIYWVPIVRRMPPIRSVLLENIRAVLYEHSEYRKKFLDITGHRIYDGWRREKKNEWVRVTYLGGARQVGRSCILLQTPESRILLDCGINVAGEGSDQYPYLDCPEFNIQELDALIISHAHLDHSGLIPYLFKYGYRGPVYCTEPTRDVMILLLLDCIKIARAENKEPLFEIDDVKEMVKHTITLDYGEVSDITPDIRLTLFNAGHILGSAVCHLHVGNGLHNLVYTGDIKFGRTPLLEPAQCIFPRVETLMIESTYGGKMNVMAPGAEQDNVLQEVIKQTVARGGKILMPVLGSGRAQDVMVIVEEMVRRKEIPELPVYIDGMVWDITAIHTAYPEFLNNNIRKSIFHRDENPFLNPIFKHVGSQKERMQVVEYEGPCIIMATSGMMVGGPCIEYFRLLADNPKNTLVFSCYQAEGSLGKRIREGEKEVTLRNGAKPETVQVNMDVCKIDISDHSDRRQLMNYVFRCSPRPKKIIVNHGENSRVLDFASSIHKQGRIETVAPRNLETIRLR